MIVLSHVCPVKGSVSHALHRVLDPLLCSCPYKSATPVVGGSSSSSLDERKPSEAALMLLLPSLPFSAWTTSSFLAYLPV